MAKSKIPHKPIPAEEREMTESQAPSISAEAEIEEEERFDKDFWSRVITKARESSVPWNRAMDEVRVERFIEKHDGNLFNTLVFIINKWPKMKKYKDKPDSLRSLECVISRLTEIILEDERLAYKKAKDFRFKEKESEPTLLHFAAKQNFLHVAQCLVERYPGLLYLNTFGDKEELPVELALRKHQDDTAAYLISQMKYDRVQELFLCDEDDEDNDNKQPMVKFYFGEIISYRNPQTNQYGMKKTVVAVLNKLINPRWPYLPDRQYADPTNADIQRALDSVPDDPMNYDFFYHILEADENGRTPQNEVTEYNKDGEEISSEWIINSKFNKSSVSCLRRIADSENEEAVQHPVVRMLVAKKWNEFAYKRYCIKAGLYLLFLAVLSFAVIFGSTRVDPTQYNDPADKFRALCEICSIAFLVFHLFQEIVEIASEGKLYLKIWHNWLDLPAIILTLLVLPLRFAENESQWGFAAIGYLLNVLRIFKYANVTRTTGLYTSTLVKIVQEDVVRFMSVFCVIFVGFCGSLYVALKMDDMQDSFTNFAWLLLAGVRVLVEGQPIEEDYEKQKFGWLVILILLVYMGTVIVILLNILIAQLSYTYGEAKKTAKLQYAVDTMKIVSRMECSIFPCWNFRVNKYEEGVWISDEDLAREILESEERHPWETVEERVTNAREIMRKYVRKGQETDPLETIGEQLTRLTATIEKLSKSK